jgi:DNA-binding MarR family transcriptional regulator
MTDLFEWSEQAHARSTDPETSHAAAASVDCPPLDRKLHDGLKLLGSYGATSEELADQLNLRLVSVSPRLRPMERRGLVRETEERRPGASGRLQIVWVAI